MNRPRNVQGKTLAIAMRHCDGGGARGIRAFTVTELLVVIGLVVILVLIAVPSFQSMLTSQAETLAENQLRSAIRVARDAAIRSGSGRDAGAVFFFEPGGRTTVVPCVKVGEIVDEFTPGGEELTREVFAPAPGFSPVVLPRNYAVRGYAPPNSVGEDWYGNSPFATTNNADRLWVFPETGFYDLTKTNDGLNRSTFMVRFRGGTGVMVTSPSRPSLVFAPRPSSDARTGGVFATFRADRAEDPERFVQDVIDNPVLSKTDRRSLIGRESGDMVMARAVSAIALYDDTKLMASLRVSPDRFTRTIYQAPTINAGDYDFTGYKPQAVSSAGGAGVTIANINLWMEGDSNLDGGVGDADDGDVPEAKLLMIDRYTGALLPMEVQP